MRSEVAYNKGIVKYILKGFFRHQNVGGGGGGSAPPTFCPLFPCSAAYVSGRYINVEKGFIWLFYLYIYILNFAENSDLLCCKDVVMFLHSCTIYILAFLQT